MEKMKYTKYEMARIIGARALQITMGSPLLVEITEEFLQKINYSPIEIAKEEFKKGILPITIKRPLPKRFISTT